MKNKTIKLLPFFVVIVLSACARNSPPPPRAEQPVTAATAVQQASSPQSSLTQVPASSPISASTNIKQLSGRYLFSEGPATDANGDVYFSDINAGKIYKWSTSANGELSVFVEGLAQPNGLMFDKSGNMVACEGGNGRLIAIDPQGQVTSLVDQYNGMRFNEPNDLWIDARGGIYFSDPAYQLPIVQDGQHVYYLSPDRSQVTRVISDMQKPNGLVGSADGKTLFVSDHGAGKTYSYSINNDGSLTNKTLFAGIGSDGMELDGKGNLFLTTPNKVKVFDAAGTSLFDIPLQENPTNLAFAGEDGMTLFITARTAVYTVQLLSTSPNASTAPNASTSPNSSTAPNPSTAGFALTSPDLPADSRLPIEYTCDGASSTLALTWSGAPTGTQSYAVIMHHIPPTGDSHWYWVLYNIPANVTSLPKNSSGIGTLGSNSVNDRNEYTPPCSKGPGDKTYFYTVYALSAAPQLSTSATQVNRAALLEAIKEITLASAELQVVYARP